MYWLKILFSGILALLPILCLCPVKIKLSELILFAIIQQIVIQLGGNIWEYFITIGAIICAYFFMKYKTKNRFLSFVLAIFNIMIILISDCFVSDFYIFVLRKDLSVYLLNNRNYYIYIFMMMFLIVVLSGIIGYYLNKKIQIFNIKFLGIQSTFIIILYISNIIMFYASIILGKANGISNQYISFNGIILPLYFLITTVIIFYLFVSINKDFEIKHKDELITNVKLYSAQMEDMFQSLNRFKHDHTNLMLSLSMYLVEKNYTGLEDYFFKTVAIKSQDIMSNIYKLGSLHNLKLTEIKGIIAVKVTMAQEKGIDFSISIDSDITIMYMDIIDMNRLLGILLDNAIEASEHCNRPYIKFAMIKNDDSITIIIVNSCLDKIQDMDKIFQLGFSTKGENRGVGLSSLKEIIKNYQDVLLDISSRDNEFKVILEVGEGSKNK